MVSEMLAKKKGQLMTSGPLAVAIATVFGLFLIGILIFAFSLAGAQMYTSVTNNSTAQHAIGNMTAGAAQYAGFSPTLWVLAAIGALITIVLVSFGGYFLLTRR